MLSNWLVAVIVTICCVETAAGAEYNPLALIVPAVSARHVNVSLQTPTGVALNCCCWDPYSVAAPGLTTTPV